MSNKKFFLMILASILVLLGALVLLNVVVNPFGVFSEKLFNRNDFNFTNNPRTGKMTYLDQRKNEFDSFIVGSSGTAAIAPGVLGKYTGTRPYNLFYYGSDMLDSYNTIKYLVESRRVKNIFFGINYTSAMTFDAGEDLLTHKMPYYVANTSKFSYYKDYLLANPKYSTAKIRNYYNDSYYPQAYKVFLEDTGQYDKRARDVEGIGALSEYLDKDDYNFFKEYPQVEKNLSELDKFAEYMKKIKDLSKDYNFDLEVAVFPVYKDDFSNFKEEELREFYKKLAGVTEFWDFSKSSISRDPRYFYDATHVRNAVGDMILSKIYGGDTYVPEDFGTYVDKGNLEEFLEDFNEFPLDDENINMEKRLAVLMFHHFGPGDYALDIEDFQNKLAFLKEEGYETVSLKDMYEYVYKGAELPEKPFLITMDDGYMSNYSQAFPVLKEEGMKAVIFTIGHSFGKDEYKETKEPIIPHFGEREAKEMLESSLVEIQSHTYDMHQSEKLEDKDEVRINVKQLPAEGEGEYIEAFKRDFEEENKLIKSITGEQIHSFSYPMGYYTEETEVLLRELGVKSSFTSDPGANVLVKGLPQSLFALKRINVSRGLSNEDLLLMMKGDHNK